jgi:hypothetical protein
MKKMSTILSGLLLSLASFQAFAQDCGGRPCTVPEPGSLTLLVIGGVSAAAAIAWSRGKNKKK